MNRAIAIEAEVYNGGLLLSFTNGDIRFLNIESFLKGKIFKPLNDVKNLSKFKISHGAIEWDCGPCLCADTVYLRSVKVNTSQSTYNCKSITM